MLQGSAETIGAAGGVQAVAGAGLEVSGSQVASVQVEPDQGDDFAWWVEQRRQPVGGESAIRVDARYARQASQLDSYGSWVYVDSASTWAWQPQVTTDWQPYTVGSWYWTPTGWSWLSYEPWGWLPYHYGSWWYAGGYGWLWCWGSYWGPAWVHWMHYPGYVGWCPAGYYDWWYWDNCGSWCGGYDHPHHGSGHSQPPRSDVQPRPGGRQLPPVSEASAAPPSRFAVDMNGRVNTAQVDPTGWSVARSEDFASPHLSRVVKPGQVAFRSAGATEAVVTSGPLITDAPSRVSPRTGVEQAFDRVDRVASPDLSPILSRQGSLDPAVAVTLAEPTTTDRISRRTGAAASLRFANRESGSTPATAASGAPTTRQVAPNIHRSSIAPSPTGSRTIHPRPTLSGGPVSTTPAQRYQTSPRASSPAQRNQPSAPSASGSTTRSAPSRVVPPQARTLHSGGGARPVIVPNTSGMRPSRSLPSQSAAPYRSGPSSSAVRSAPSARAPSTGSTPRSAPSSSSRPSPSGGSRSSPAPSSSGSHRSPSSGSPSRR